MRAILSAVVGLLAAAVTLATSTTDTLHYAVREEIAVGSAIADIVTDAGLHVYGLEVRTRTVNSAFHPSGVGKSSTGLHTGGVMAGHVHLCRVAGNAVWSRMAGDAP